MKIHSSEPFEFFSVAGGSACWGNPNHFNSHVNVFYESFINESHSFSENLETTGKGA